MRKFERLREEFEQLLSELEKMAEKLTPPPVGGAAAKPPEGLSARMETEYLSASDAAQLLHVSPATIYRWAREGRFPKGESWGPRTRRWRKVDLEKWTFA